MIRTITPIIVSAIVLASCGNKKETDTEEKPTKLPYIGQHDVDDNGDTIYHTVPGFELIDQDSAPFSYENLGGKIHIADFFFTNCETICPQMTSHMKKVAKKIEGLDNVMILSFSVDPENDSPSVLKQYAEVNGINTKKWKFLTGDESYIHELGGEGYMLNAMRDSAAQGGFLHSEFFVMVDQAGRIRGIYDGTNSSEVEKLMKELDILLKEGEK